jgi:hypothetical protein
MGHIQKIRVRDASDRLLILFSRTQILVITLRTLLTQKTSHVRSITKLNHKVCARILANTIRNRTCGHCIFIDD